MSSSRRSIRSRILDQRTPGLRPNATIDADPKLRADLHGVNKEVTASGHIRFAGESPDSHCDRFWAKALRQWAATRRFGTPGIAVA